jgi:hypothetical protein
MKSVLTGTIIGLFVAVSVVGGACAALPTDVDAELQGLPEASGQPDEIDGMPVEYVSASYVVDMSDPVITATEVDYVFVGRIESELGVEQPFGVGSVPVTQYSVRVLENLKGDLVQDVPIEVKTNGGYDGTARKYVLMEGESLPLVGACYLLAAFTQEDGALLLSGPLSALRMDVPDSVLGASGKGLLNAIRKDRVFQQFVLAVEEAEGKEKAFGKPTVLSKYDVQPDRPGEGEIVYEELGEQSVASG